MGFTFKKKKRHLRTTFICRKVEVGFNDSLGLLEKGQNNPVDQPRAKLGTIHAF